MDKNEPNQQENQQPESESMPAVFIDDILMSLKYYVDELQPHIKILNPEICLQCQSKSCLYFCPAGVYRQGDDGGIQVSYLSCIECGCCRVMCPHQNVEWNYPRGGFGVNYKFG